MAYLVKDGDGDGQCGACVGYIHNAGQPALTGAAGQQQVHLQTVQNSRDQQDSGSASYLHPILLSVNPHSPVAQLVPGDPIEHIQAERKQPATPDALTASQNQNNPW